MRRWFVSWRRILRNRSVRRPDRAGGRCRIGSWILGRWSNQNRLGLSRLIGRGRRLIRRIADNGLLRRRLIRTRWFRTSFFWFVLSAHLDLLYRMDHQTRAYRRGRKPSSECGRQPGSRWRVRRLGISIQRVVHDTGGRARPLAQPRLARRSRRNLLTDARGLNRHPGAAEPFRQLLPR
jgi:hypothetical protein